MSQKHDAAHLLINNAAHYRRVEQARKWTEQYMNAELGKGAAARIPETGGFYRGPGARGARGEAVNDSESSDSDGDQSD